MSHVGDRAFPFVLRSFRFRKKTRCITTSMTFDGDYSAHFRAQLNRLKTENRYRHFVELERIVGRHPVALRHHNGAAQEVSVWCSNDYLGMGQHPDVIAAMRAAA